MRIGDRFGWPGVVVVAAPAPHAMARSAAPAAVASHLHDARARPWTFSPMAAVSFSLRAGIRRVGAMLGSAPEAVQRHFPIDFIGSTDEVPAGLRRGRAPRYSTRHDIGHAGAASSTSGG